MELSTRTLDKSIRIVFFQLTKVDLTSTDLVNFDNEEVIPVVDLPPPPDGGWGWVICFASFMCNLVLDGIAYTFGVLLEPLVEYFGSDRLVGYEHSDFYNTPYGIYSRLLY